MPYLNPDSRNHKMIDIRQTLVQLLPEPRKVVKGNVSSQTFEGNQRGLARASAPEALFNKMSNTFAQAIAQSIKPLVWGDWPFYLLIQNRLIRKYGSMPGAINAMGLQEECQSQISWMGTIKLVSGSNMC